MKFKSPIWDHFKKTLNPFCPCYIEAKTGANKKHLVIFKHVGRIVK